MSEFKPEKLYFILCGESVFRRSRSKKLLRLIKNDDQEYLVFVSGWSGFDLDRYIPQSYKLKEFLVSRGIPGNKIITEDKALDTLGNMVLSYEKIITQVLPRFNTIKEIVLITEDFHMTRSKDLFMRIFNFQKGIKFTFESSDTFDINNLFYKRSIKIIFEKIRKLFLLDLADLFSSEGRKKFKKYDPKKNIFDVISKSLNIKTAELISIFPFVALLCDIKKLNLRSFSEFYNYMLSLPFYSHSNKFPNPTQKFDMEKSMYLKLINLKYKNRLEERKSLPIFLKEIHS